MLRLFKKRITKNDLAISLLEKIVDEGCIVNENKLVCKEGIATTKSLYNKKDEDFAIALTRFTKGAVSTRHFHGDPIIEHIVIIKGMCVFDFFDKSGLKVISSTTIKTGESITIPSDLIHEALFLKNTDLIAMTIPRDETFPK